MGWASQSKDQKAVAAQLHKEVKVSSSLLEQGQGGAGPDLGGIHICCKSYCIAQASFYKILMNRTACSELKIAPMSVLPRLHSGQTCLELSAQLIAVLRCARSFPLSLSEYLWTRKMLDLCDLRCGLFSGFNLFYRPSVS